MFFFFLIWEACAHRRTEHLHIWEICTLYIMLAESCSDLGTEESNKQGGSVLLPKAGMRMALQITKKLSTT